MVITTKYITKGDYRIMCNKNTNPQQPFNESVEINTTRHDGNGYGNFSHVNASVESGGTKPIDISLMAGTGQNKEGE